MTERLYTAAETEVIRQKVLNNYALPKIKIVFAKYPQIKSAHFSVAQFWDDQAHDQVHDWLVYSVLDVPDSDAHTRSENKDSPLNCSNWSDLEWDNYFNTEIKDIVNLPGISEEEYTELITDDEWERLVNSPDFYDSNGMENEFVAAFAAFCKEGSNQCMDYSEAYTPYALFTRIDTGIKVEIVGKMWRPWLDGIRPEADY